MKMDRQLKHRHNCKQLMQPTINILIAILVRSSLFVVFPRNWQSYLKISFSSFVALKVMWLRFWAFIVLTHLVQF